MVDYDGSARIDGVPGTAAPIMLDFRDIAGSSCGALLPTGNSRDSFAGVETTCIDNGMPVVLLRAADLGKTGSESPAELEADAALKAKVEEIRLAAGRAMNLGDVAAQERAEDEPGLGARARRRASARAPSSRTRSTLRSACSARSASPPPACSPARSRRTSSPATGGGSRTLDIEHPTGFFTVELELAPGNAFSVTRSALLRTARLLMRGEVLVPGNVWSGPA